MSVSGTPVTTYDDGFPKAHPSLPPSTRRSGRGGVQRRTRVEYRRSRPTSSQRVVEGWGHAISSGRTREPRHSGPRSDLEHRGEGGRGGWGLGKPVVVRRDRRTGNRPAGGGHRGLVDPGLGTGERGGGGGGALGNPSSYVGTGVPATDRRAVGQTVRSGVPRPHPPHPPGGSAAVWSPL